MKAEFFAVAIIICAVRVRGYPTQLDNEIDDDWDESSMFGNDTNEPHLPLTPYSYVNIPEEVEFYLYPNDRPDSPTMTKLSDPLLFNGKIDVSKPVKILIHGYMSGKDKAFGRTMREAYLKKGAYTVIIVDWSGLAKGLYPTVKARVPEMGRTVAEFIDKLSSQTNLPVERLHVLGHSLGAHVSGVAGAHVTKGKIMRITGLDPAGPMFDCHDKERLQATSASFVDVIHTCGGGLGFSGSLGLVDFYPNAGKAGQPGCGISLGKCSHGRAAQYYAESLSNPEGFYATKCEHWKNYLNGDCEGNPTTSMGEFVSFDARGDYWLSTNKAPPFAVGPAVHRSDASRMTIFKLLLAILLAITLYTAV